MDVRSNHQAQLLLGVLLAVFAFTANAMINSVSPLQSALWYANNSGIPAATTPAAACDAYNSSSYAYYSSSQYYSLGNKFLPHFGNGYDCVITVLTGPYAGYSGVSGFVTLIQSATCPNATPAYTYNPTSGMCERDIQEQYILTLTPETATPIEPGQSTTFTATVTKQGGGAPSQAVPVTVKVEVKPTSGGHDHSDSTRPKGEVSPTTGTNSLSITFTSTEVSGTHKITATCELCQNKSATAKVDVKVAGLRTITAEPALYALIGGETGKPHHDNHYLTNNAFNQLVVLAINYHFLYPNDPILHLNDASLVWGGKFDIKGNWVGYHAGHRRGTVIDVRANTALGNIPERLFKNFIRLAKDTKLADGVTSAQAQLHCSTGFDPATNCAGDDNRHYHVLLLGVDQ